MRNVSSVLLGAISAGALGAAILSSPARAEKLAICTLVAEAAAATW
ncbi:hypothetical protein A6302_02244 [Methylobrevis pamukkalensis]|uniref:Uncharacterized protein n=1 Tax=Methylobrevis pamukkalensis TaxID=1439726 RepID=A0A1E3H4J5_9HYPH|nr:hypothetical protein [Methylobrevis pamukkalensis]ODN70441.1 hypothetical protein A6302_02244 [Methylobrevis pamukkalensis]